MAGQNKTTDMQGQDKMLEAVAIFDEACLYEDFEEGGALYVNNSMIKDNEDPDYKDVTFGVMDKATGKRGLVNMTVLAEYVDAGEDKSIVPVDAYGQNEVWNDSGKWSVHGLDLGDYVGGYAQHVAEMQVSETQIQAGHGNFLRVADSMIADIPGDINNHKIVTLGLMDGNGKKTVGTVAVPWEDMDPDWDAVSLPESQRATYVGFASDSNYLFHEIGGDMRSMRGSEIIEQGNAYARDSLKEKQAPEAQAQAGQKKPTNLLRVNDSMIKNTKRDGLKAVTIGLRDADGKEKLGTIFVGNKQVNADKNTTELPKSQQKGALF